MKSSTFFALLLVLWHLSIGAQSPDNWEYQSERDGIKIYHQESPGMMHIKLTTSWQAPLAGIVTLFSDVNTYTSWGYKMVEARLLKRVSETEIYYYARYDFPWPMEDRDIILRSRIEQDAKTHRVSITNTPQPDFLAEVPGVQRIKNTTTRWLFVPGNNGWVYTEQQISTDSAADAPDWLVKMTIDTGPRETAKAIRRMLQQPRFQQASLPYIKG